MSKLTLLEVLDEIEETYGKELMFEHIFSQTFFKKKEIIKSLYHHPRFNKAIWEWSGDIIIDEDKDTIFNILPTFEDEEKFRKEHFYNSFLYNGHKE